MKRSESKGRLPRLLLLAAFATLLLGSCSRYRYEQVEGDPLQTRIYTLDNGLKVYLSVNPEAPRIQTYIAVRVGAKNDPAQTTGLAHYFEHLMFKGTERFGTQDYAAERPLLDRIEQLFECYRRTADTAERRAIYARIDSVSNEAAKIAIPNEYDKLMSAIGSSGSNAWTSYDETVYTEDIPANQLENWARIQSDRFRHNVIRGFHTELEAVYEEYNMSLASDTGRMFDSLLCALYPRHPYGQHSVLGTQEHLKNPSITQIKRYYATYYVPNNMAVCLSGDLDPERTIRLIDRYFGEMTPNDSLPAFRFEAEPEATAPVEKRVVGPEAEMLYMGWRTGDARSDDALMCELASAVLSNGLCGLMDVDLIQQQRILAGGADVLQFTDYGAMIAVGLPKAGQSLDEVRDLLLGEVAKLRSGDFDETLLPAAVANARYRQTVDEERNETRAQEFVDSFIAGTDWADHVTRFDRMARITKEQLVEWARRTLRDDNYAAVYKVQGADPGLRKIEKPQITPIATNRDCESDFLAEIRQTEPEAIAPRFLDFTKDLSVTHAKQGIPVLYKHNGRNDLFELTYLYDFGRATDPALGVALEDYLPLLGTDSLSVEAVKRALYELACDFRVTVGDERTYVHISGLAEQMPRAVRLVEEYMQRVAGDETVLEALKDDLFKARADAKLSQDANEAALRRYTNYGAEAIRRTTLSDAQLRALTSEALVERIRSLNGYAHRVLYYGPATQQELLAQLDTLHRTAPELKHITGERLALQPVREPRVDFVQYDGAKQIAYRQYSNRGEQFSADNDAEINLFNAYFGTGMGSIVFQEMREARGLAYSAVALLSSGRDATQPYIFWSYIATQNDKMRQAVEAFARIIEEMPRSEAAFELARQSLLGNLSTQRTTGADVLWAYIQAQDFGVDFDRNRAVYEKIRRLTLDDMMRFHAQWIRGRKYVYSILGDSSDLDMDYLRTLGPIHRVSREEIFGY